MAADEQAPKLNTRERGVIMRKLSERVWSLGINVGKAEFYAEKGGFPESYAQEQNPNRPGSDGKTPLDRMYEQARERGLETKDIEILQRKYENAIRIGKDRAQGEIGDASRAHRIQERRAKQAEYDRIRQGRDGPKEHKGRERDGKGRFKPKPRAGLEDGEMLLAGADEALAVIAALDSGNDHKGSGVNLKNPTSDKGIV